MKKLIIFIILVISISFCNSQDKETTIQPGSTYNQKLFKGEKHKYKIKLNKSEFCSLVVMQRGVDVVVDVLDPSSKKIASVDTPNGNNGPELIEFAADSKGNYELEIYPLNDYTGMTESQKIIYIEQNQGDYEISSVSVLSKDEYSKKFAEEKLKKVKFNKTLNLGFEKTTANEKLPDNWFKWGYEDYNLRIDSNEKHNGKYAILIEPEADKTENSFGCVAFSIPPDFKGTEIELKAYMKMENIADGQIGLMLRLDGSTGMLKFDNMQQKNIQGTSDWTLYSVKLPFPEETRAIYIGALLSGTGKLWVDDFQLLIDGTDISEVKYFEPKKYKAEADKEFYKGSKISSIDLTQTNIDNLDILGKVWGFLKYYHPAVASGEYNWDFELFRVMPKVLAAENQEQRNEVLYNWTQSLGKTSAGKVEVNTGKEVKLSPDLAWIDNTVLGEKLTSQLINIKNAERTDTNYYIDLFRGVGNPIFKNENPYYEMMYPDAGFRLLALFRYWNIIQYFFPYKHLIGEDWNNVLKEFIPLFVNASDELQYKLASSALIVRIHDTHAAAWEDNTLSDYYGHYLSPVKVSFIENKAVVTDYYDEALGKESGLMIGDVIETINGRLVGEIVTEKLTGTAASNYPTQLRIIAQDLLRARDSSLIIGYERGNSKMTAEIKCLTYDKIDFRNYSQRDTCFRLIGQDISYIYPGTIKNKYLPDIMKEVMKTKGLIIDLRCYPSDFIVFTLSEYLQPDSAAFVKFSSGSITMPGLFTMSENLNVVNKNENFYKGKVVIIVNQETQSQAEYTTMAFRTAPDATVIGSTTAGADGNVSEIVLPGNVKTMISGIGVYYPDGKETQRIGIVPDIEVKPTLKGIQEGRDELLEKAIEIINGN